MRCWRGRTRTSGTARPRLRWLAPRRADTWRRCCGSCRPGPPGAAAPTRTSSSCSARSPPTSAPAVLDTPVMRGQDLGPAVLPLRRPCAIRPALLCRASQLKSCCALFRMHVKLLGDWRTNHCRPSYVEGRLKLAEKERIRARAKAEAAAAAGGDGAGGAVSRAAALAEAAAQADANMMALLEEESKLQVSLLQTPILHLVFRYMRMTAQHPVRCSGQPWPWSCGRLQATPGCCEAQPLPLFAGG